MAHYMLTTRLVGEVCKRNGYSFSSFTTKCRRLDKLRKSGLIHRDRMLTTGEWYYWLSREGAGIIEAEHVIEIPSRAISPVKPLMQSHEFDLSRFWIKFLDDCRKLNIRVLDFQRDGQFVFHHGSKKLIPDGAVVLRIRGKARVFFVEMDRSTQTSGIGGRQKAVIRQKLERYRHLNRHLLWNEDLLSCRVHSMRLIIVCRSEARLRNLCAVAHDMGIRHCAVTCWPRLIDVTKEHTAYGWNYKPANMLAAPLFAFPAHSGRSPPASILAR